MQELPEDLLINMVIRFAVDDFSSPLKLIRVSTMMHSRSFGQPEPVCSSGQMPIVSWADSITDFLPTWKRSIFAGEQKIQVTGLCIVLMRWFIT